MQQGSGSSNIKAIDVNTATDSIFTGTGISDSSNGCDAIYFYAFQEILMSNSYSDASITLTPADSISSAAASVTT
jgi:hypothetical protein